MSKPKSKITSNINRQITSISIDKDLAVKIGISEVAPITSPGVIIDSKSKGNGAEDDDDDKDDEGGAFIATGYTIDSQRRAHKDFVDAMKSLRKFALDLCEIDVDSKLIGAYTVCKVKIDGDVDKKQSRAVMTLAKTVKSTDKIVKIGPTRQVTMYGESDYGKAEAMSKAIESCIDEAYAYLAGKAEESDQLPLFSPAELQLA